ncbi:hypothetical protein MG293_020831 [Ovis ammon polii]|uniref:Uncharacterized protein n=1 Tax=Ovis ammon polii TaxID=230172 RepID=A0AAD4TJC4_OVIAM|nr:hypothetical protein MG293_020831 [Ovis ammon polii]KAI4550015.1 hypothetical protein MJT46_019164 [Ovis ammon polii x Ovis aries]
MEKQEKDFQIETSSFTSWYTQVNSHVEDFATTTAVTSQSHILSPLQSSYSGVMVEPSTFPVRYSDGNGNIKSYHCFGIVTPLDNTKVLLDLCLKDDTRNQTLSYLLKKAKQEDPAAPKLPEAEGLHDAHSEHQEDPEGGAAGLCRGLGGKLHLESGHFVQCLSVTLLKGVGLGKVNLTSLSLEPLQVLIKRTSATLQDLDLGECGIMDSKFRALLPSLSHCSQITTFSFCSNPICMAMLESLLHHTVGLSKQSDMLYPAPLESYEYVHSTLNLGFLSQLHARLKQLLCKAWWPIMVWFSTNPSPHCGDQIFYDIKLILYPFYMPA